MASVTFSLDATLAPAILASCPICDGCLPCQHADTHGWLSEFITRWDASVAKLGASKKPPFNLDEALEPAVTACRRYDEGDFFG